MAKPEKLETNHHPTPSEALVRTYYNRSMGTYVSLWVDCCASGSPMHAWMTLTAEQSRALAKMLTRAAARADLDVVDDDDEDEE